MNKVIKYFKNRLNNRSDQGAGLITILGVSMVVLIVAGSITASAAFSTNFTYSQLSSHQANDLAEAGLAEAVDNITSGNCIPTNGDDEDYRFRVYGAGGDTAPSSVNSENVRAGCPRAVHKWVVIEALGKGENNAQNTITAVYELPPANTLPHAITAGKIDLTNVKSISSNSGLSSSQPSIYVKDGDAAGSLSDQTRNSLACGGPSSPINANIYLNNTAIKWLSFSNDANKGCTVNGNIYANDAMSVSSTTFTNVPSTSTNQVNGDVCSPKNINDNSKKINGERKYNTDCGFYGGMYGYVPDEGANRVNYTDAVCSKYLNTKSKIVQEIEAYSYIGGHESYILDFSKCKTYFGVWNNTLAANINISSNLTIIPPTNTSGNLLLNNFTINSKTGKNYDFNIVRPSGDANRNESTACTSTVSDTFTNIQYGQGIKGVTYSPCNLNIVNSNINGQMYSGGRLVINNSSLVYMPTELPNAKVELPEFKTTTGNAIKTELVRIK